MFTGLFKNKKNVFVLCLLFLEFILVFMNGVRFNKDTVFEISQNDLLICESEGNYISGFYADHSSIEGSYVATPLLFLEKGIYNITVGYNSNSDGDWHSCYTTVAAEYDTSREKTANLVYCDKIGLPGDSSLCSYRCWVRYGTDYRVTLGPETDASGDGIYVLADKVTVTYMKTPTILLETFKLLLFFLAADFLLLIILFRKKEACHFLSGGNEIIIAGLLFIIGFSSYPLLSRVLYFGDDIFYHLRRVAYLAQGLKSGTFPVKIQPGWDNNYGYAVGVGYGDLLLIPSAILVVLGCTIQFAYKFYIFLTNVLTALISYHAYKKISGNKYTGLLCSGLFTLMGFRLHSIYAGATVGEFGAYTFLPLVILGLYEIYQSSKKQGYITLALGITFTLGSHVVSTLILAIVIPLFCLIMLERTIKKEVIQALVKAFFLTVILNLYFIVPCLEYLLFQDMIGNTNFATLWQNGQEMVNLLVNLDDVSHDSGGWSGIGFYSLIVLSLAAGAVVTGKFKEKTSVYLRILLCLSGLIFLSTNSIAYYWLKDNVRPVYALVGNIQFPWHFLNVCCGLIVFFAAKVLEILFRDPEKRQIGLMLAAMAATLCICQSADLLRNTISEGKPVTMYDSAKLSTGGPKEFAIRGSDRGMTANTDMTVDDAAAGADMIQRKGTTIYARINNPSRHTVTVQAPLWGYRHYAAKAGNVKLNVGMSESKKVAVEIPAGFDGLVKIYFHEPWYWRVSEIISLLGVIGVGRKLVLIRRRK